MRWEKKAEIELTHKLKKLFKITFERTISKLQEMKSVPSSDIIRKPLLFEIESLREEFKEIISESVIESVNVGRERVLLFADSLAVETEMHFENLIMKQAIVEIPLLEYSKQFEKLIRDSVFIASDATMDRIMGDIMENLADSYVQGLGIGEASNRLKKVFDSIEDYRLERIARTEIQSYQNLGSHHTCIDLGVQYEQWWSARDERVRSSHAYLHGQIVRTGDSFSNGLMYPGDRSGPIEEWIQCRCRLVPFLMPFGYTAPVGQPYFYEGDLIESGLEEPEFVLATTTEEAQEWAEINLGVKTKGYKNLELDLINELHKEYSDLMKKYPSGTKNLSRIFVSKAKGNARAGVSGTSNIWGNYNLNIYMQHIYDKESLISTVKYARDIGYLTKIDKANEMKGLFTHEYAHLLFQTYKIPKIVIDLPVGYMECESGLEKIKKSYEYAIRDLKKKCEDGILSRSEWQSEYGKMFISMRAEKNIDEFLAESFVQVELNKSPSRYAIDAVNILMKFLGKQ